VGIEWCSDSSRDVSRWAFGRESQGLSKFNEERFESRFHSVAELFPGKIRAEGIGSK
jgi:hypothetical protein